MGAGTGTGMTKVVFGDTRAAGDRERRGVADGCARVPEILTAPELERLFAGVMGPELLKRTRITSQQSIAQLGCMEST